MQVALPKHLNGDEPTGLQPGQPIAQYRLGDLRNFVYLIVDWTTKRAAIVDPHAGLGPLNEDLARNGLTLAAILLTHTHFDHVLGLPELAQSHPALPLYFHPLDGHRLKTLPFPRPETQTLANLFSFPIQPMHTPGHSAGELCYFMPTLNPPALFTGDTLFIRDCGRTDFADGSDEDMFASLQAIKRLPPATVILPGHHYAREVASTLACELETSPPLRCASVEELRALP